MTSVVRCLAGMLLVTVAFMPLRFALAEPLHIYAAGSLTGAFTDMVKAFPAAEGDVATPVFGPSGVLCEKIEHGDHVDVFASADMVQPRTLARSHSGSSVVMFTRNRLCALGRASVGMTTDNLLDRLLDPSVRLAPSTPGDRHVCGPYISGQSRQRQPTLKTWTMPLIASRLRRDLTPRRHVAISGSNAAHCRSLIQNSLAAGSLPSVKELESHPPEPP